jgi:hypothetical protein
LNIDTPRTAAPLLSDKRPWIHGLPLTLGLLALWTLTHRYRGLENDGLLYALQAVARIQRFFGNDVILRGTSQDSFTFFSPLYAALIRMFGIVAASTLLFTLCTAGYLCAAWFLVRRLFGSYAAYLAVAVLICVPLEYGAWSVFHCHEDFLTARSFAEACVVGSVAAYFWQRPWLAAGLIGIGTLIHPLMALPGLLLLLCLATPIRIAAMVAALGLACVALAALAAVHGFAPVASLKPMAPAWLEVVEERTMFLFLKDWRAVDWEVQLRPLLFLAVAQAIIGDARVRKLCWAAGLVGLSGLALAAVPDVVGPIPILLQGQAWRWIWITCTIAACLTAPSALIAWRSGGWGPLCASVLVAGWVFTPINGELAFAGAAAIWAMRSHTRDPGRTAKLAAYAVAGIISAWTITNAWELVDNTVLHSTSAFDPIALTRWTFSLVPLALAVAWLIELLVRRFRFGLFLAPILLVALVTCFLPSSLFWPTGFDAIRNQYKSWRDAIPESSSVLLLAPPPVSAAFQWFTLERTSYLSSSQSAGVVFSESIAAEIRRRSDTLKPVMAPEWRVLSQNRLPRLQSPTDTLTPPVLTAKSLQEICKDGELGFVVAKDDVGFSPVRHAARGDDYTDWNLYDCRRVRAHRSDAI